MDFTLPAKPTAKSNAKSRKCDAATLRKAWPYFWHPIFREKADAMVKMQWQAFKEAVRTDPDLRLSATKIAAAFQYIFGRYTKHCQDEGLVAPIYALIATIDKDNKAEQEKLFDDMYNSPRVTGPHTKICWKLHRELPKELAQYGRQADIVFQQELMSAQKRAIQRLKGEPV